MRIDADTAYSLIRSDTHEKAVPNDAEGVLCDIKTVKIAGSVRMIRQLDHKRRGKLSVKSKDRKYCEYANACPKHHFKNGSAVLAFKLYGYVIV